MQNYSKVFKSKNDYNQREAHKNMNMGYMPIFDQNVWDTNLVNSDKLWQKVVKR